MPDLDIKMSNEGELFATFFQRFHNITPLRFAFSCVEDKILLTAKAIKSVSRSVLYRLIETTDSDENVMLLAQLDSELNSDETNIPFRTKVSANFLHLFGQYSQRNIDLNCANEIGVVPLFKLSNKPKKTATNHLLELHSYDKLLELTINALLYLRQSTANSRYYFTMAKSSL